MMTSHCQICGNAKDPSEYAHNQCTACTNRGNEAQNAAKAENPELTPDQLLYIGRMAMQQRALHRGSSYVDPRQFSASRGMIPIPPQGGDRGTVPGA